jgi:hypothetical protein
VTGAHTVALFPLSLHYPFVKKKTSCFDFFIISEELKAAGTGWMSSYSFFPTLFFTFLLFIQQKVTAHVPDTVFWFFDRVAFVGNRCPEGRGRNTLIKGEERKQG